MSVRRRTEPLLKALGPVRPRGTSVGVEEEWCLHGETGRVDYRRLHASATRGLPRYFPGDPAAVLTEAGTILTVDGWEAETVTPPVELGPTAWCELDAAVSAARTDLEQRLVALLPQVRLEGWSTHISVSVPDDRATLIAARLRDRCGRSLSLLLGAGPSGVLLRPRRHRLEVCIDHVGGSALNRAVVAWAGLVLMCSDGSRRAGWRTLPHAPLEWTAARERFGHHASAEQFGGARSAVRTWGAARAYAVAAGLPTAPVDRLLDVEVPAGNHALERLGAHPRAPDLGPRTRPFGSVRARWLTWDLVAWQCGDPGVVAVLPLHANHLFVAALDEGRLDGLFKQRLSRSPVRRRSPIRR